MVPIQARRSESVGRRVTCLLQVAVVAATLSSPACRRAVGVGIEDYIFTPTTPGRRLDADGAPRPPDVWKRLGSGLYRQAMLTGWGDATFFFAPDGKTLYLTGTYVFTAFDPATGRPRYEFRYGASNISLRNLGARGIRIDLHQGPLHDNCVVLAIGSAEARELLETLSRRDDDSRLVRDARAAVKQAHVD
jgi:hypothetical protein